MPGNNHNEFYSKWRLPIYKLRMAPSEERVTEERDNPTKWDVNNVSS